VTTDSAAGDAAGPRQLRREHRRALGRDQILDAAEAVFADYGFHHASLRQIAERAEYSVGGVYSFFATKDELYRECFHRRGAAFMVGMRTALASDASPRQQLHDLADWQVGFFHAHPQFARLVIRGGAIAPPLSEPEQDAEILENFRTSIALQIDLIERGQRARQIRAGSPAVLARLFSGLISAYQTAELEAADEPAAAPEPALLHDVLEAALCIDLNDGSLS
jgi:TetR/AcrR family transcriptional regulator